MRKVLISISLLMTAWSVNAQFRFQPKFDIPLSVNGTALTKAWEGGLNATQFQTLDLNNDGTSDLVLYHRISRDITTYLYVDGQYLRSPQYDQVFPDDTRSLLILKDYDCDGRKDLFTTTSLGIKVYRNTSENGNISWAVAKDFLTFDAGSNIQMAPSDIPGIADINGDGALDIITFRFGNANSVDLYLNTGTCGSLEFIRTERRWGDFEECGCNDFVFGQACPTGGIAPKEGGKNGTQSTQHIGGKTLLLFDADNDGDMDLITSDETCETLYFMENEGDNQTALMTQVQDFPMNEPAGFPFFPSAFLEDIDLDGLEELIIATNADENLGNQIELSQHLKIYDNESSNDTYLFNSSLPFFQNQMLDLGENVYPTFFDADGDGDSDLIVGNKGLINGANFISTLHLFENTGNPVSPSFVLRDTDYLSLATENYTFIKPQFIDADNDGDLDFFYQATIAFGNTDLIYRENLGDQTFGNAESINISTSTSDSPFWYDIDEDDDLDLFLGRQFGSLSLFLNQGDFTFETERQNFAGIIDDFQRINLSINITDIDGNGVSDLLTMDQTGQLRAYRGPIDLDFLATNPIDQIYFIDDSPYTTAFGIQNSLTSVDLLGSGLPSVILGSTKGGLLFLENISENNGTVNDVILRVRPNPASTDIQILTNVNGVIQIISSSGQLIRSGIPIVPGSELTMDLAQLASGVYIFRVVSDEGQSKSTKVIIYK